MEQSNEKQLQIQRLCDTIQREDAIIHNLETQASQLVEAFNAQQADIVDSIQKEHTLDAEIEVLMEEVRVEHQQSIKLEFEDADVVKVILESTKDIEDTYLVESSVIDFKDVNGPKVHVVERIGPHYVWMMI